MPQLDTAPWFTVIFSALIVLFILFQINLSKTTYPLDPTPKSPTTQTQTNPWDKKWTKIYLPHSLPLH
uniref:ATP synthase F0 subunit 8 n=1 Tax=Petrodromus tetradactylus TaxID=113272 RepID=UPI00279CD2DA|nr:ATP synthase F0 subunit 8 [Petrodromus tetradactylus]WGO62094.1 ATP synthase F0 subunit 8 [Petrodromus tetradactylus]